LSAPASDISPLDTYQSAEDVLLLDVCEDDEWAAGHAPRAQHMALSRLDPSVLNRAKRPRSKGPAHPGASTAREIQLHELDTSSTRQGDHPVPHPLVSEETRHEDDRYLPSPCR
jgi:rhodanese-related sulfurtransferase